MCRLTLFWHDKVLLTDLPKNKNSFYSASLHSLCAEHTHFSGLKINSIFKILCTGKLPLRNNTNKNK
jgi:hypothetical protein